MPTTNSTCLGPRFDGGAETGYYGGDIHVGFQEVAVLDSGMIVNCQVHLQLPIIHGGQNGTFPTYGVHVAAEIRLLQEDSDDLLWKYRRHLA